MKQRRILIAEDEPNISFALSLELKKAGYETAVARDGQQALELILAANSREVPFHLLIVDVEMPNLTGLQLLDKLDDLAIGLPCVVITGFMTKDLIDDSVRNRPCLSLEKPFKSQALMDKVNSLLAPGDAPDSRETA